MRELPVVRALLLQFLDSILQEKDVNAAISCLTEDVGCIRSGAAGSIRGRKELTSHLEWEVQQIPSRLDYFLGEITLWDIEGNLSAVHTMLTVCGDSETVDLELSIPLTFLIRETDQGNRICLLQSSPPIHKNPKRNFLRNQPEAEENAYRLLSNSIPGGILGGYLQPGFPLYYINDQMLRYLGYTYNEFLRDTKGMVINCIHPDDRERVDAVIREHLFTKEEFVVQYRMHRKSGDYIWVSDRGKRLVLEDGRQVIISVCMDVTDLVCLQEKLQEKNDALTLKNQELEDLTNSIPGGVCEVAMDDDFTLLYGNDTFYLLYGYTPEQMCRELGNRLVHAIHEADVPDIRRTVEAAYHNGKAVFEFEKRIFRRNGDMAWVLTRGTFTDRASGPTMNCVVIDITDRKRVEKKLKISEERFRIALSKTANVVFDYDILQRTVEHSEQACEIYGLPHLIGNVPESLVENGSVHHSHVQEFLEMYAQVLSGAPSASCEVRVRIADGSYAWNRITLTTIYDEAGRPARAIGVAEDITRQKETEFAYQQGEQYRAAMLADAVIYYEMDLTKNRIEESRGAVLKCGTANQYDTLLEAVLNEVIYCDDREAYRELFNRTNVLRMFDMGKTEFTMDYRRKMPNGKYIWMQSTMHLLRNMHNGHIKGFIYVKDIDKQKLDKLSLEYRSQRDSLTGLYNKGTTESKVSQILKDSCENVCHAFLLIDVDNFKNVNDTYGHLYGDHILSDAARGIACLFRGTDVVGRIGGDEFAVLLQDITFGKAVEERAEEVCTFFSRALNRGESSCEVTCSVGVSYFRTHGLTFEELYQCADIALYEAKNRGRNRYVTYCSEMQSPQWEIHSTTAIDSDIINFSI